MQRRVLLSATTRRIGDAGMAECDHEIAPSTQFGHVTLCCLDDVAGGDVALEPRLVPDHDLGRHQPDHADPQPLQDPVFIHQIAFEHDRRRQERRAVERLDVGADEGERGGAQGRRQERQPVVELVVADRGRVVAEQVHGPDHRMVVRRRQMSRERHVIAERIALDDVAVVEQQAVGDLGARGRDQRRDLGQADRIVLPILIIIVVVDEHVQVGGLEQPDAQSRRLPVHRRQRGHHAARIQIAASAKMRVTSPLQAP